MQRLIKLQKSTVAPFGEKLIPEDSSRMLMLEAKYYSPIRSVGTPRTLPRSGAAIFGNYILKATVLTSIPHLKVVLIAKLVL